MYDLERLVGRLLRSLEEGFPAVAEYRLVYSSYGEIVEVQFVPLDTFRGRLVLVRLRGDGLVLVEDALSGERLASARSEAAKRLYGMSLRLLSVHPSVEGAAQTN